MAEYWKSQPKHYCKFCDCWIADNKPSKDYHERGKKHQQNVQAKINQVHKKTRDDAKKKAETNSYMKEMEKRALAAAKKDIERDPSLAAMYGVPVQEAPEYGPANISPSVSLPAKGPQKKTVASKKTPTPKPKVVKEQTEEQPANNPVDAVAQDFSAPEYWDEDKSPEGYVYFWNTVTGESRWVPPEGYIPRAERNDPTENTVAAVSEETAETESVERTSENEQNEGDDEENDTDGTRGIKRKIDEEPDGTEDQAGSSAVPTDSSSVPTLGDTPDPAAPTVTASEPQPEVRPPPQPQYINMGPKHSAYSAWEHAKEPEPEPEVDLQLPETKVVEETMLTVYEEPKMKFREKTVSSLNKDNLPAVFNKKKKGIGYRNLKSRTDDL